MLRALPLIGFLTPLLLPAQGSGTGSASIPAELLPPPGMCRIIVNGVPPNKQPAPTDCATALRNKPGNGTVVFGAPANGARGNGARGDAARGNGPGADSSRSRTPKDSTKARRDTLPKKPPGG